MLSLVILLMAPLIASTSSLSGYGNLVDCPKDSLRLIGPNGLRVGTILEDDSVRADSTFFNPGGYYTPTDTVQYHGYQIEVLTIWVLEYGYGGRFQENPMYVPESMLVLQGPREENGGGYRSRLPVVTPDSLDLCFPETPVGLVRITGKFRKGGQFWNQRVIHSTEPVVLDGHIVVVNGGREVYSRDVAFAYFPGD
jgi:hypothetical protein